MGLISSLPSRVSDASHQVGLRLCSMGWHRRPLDMEPCPPGVPKAAYRLNPRYRCGRCGMLGRMDSYGNLAELDEDPALVDAMAPRSAGPW